MSDVEEPPTKMSKYEEYLDPEEGEECLEEGQEEWLSEGVLTDDDYIQTTEQDQEQDKSDNTLPTNAEDIETTQTSEETDIIQTTTVIGQVELHDGSITHATITHGTIAHSNSNRGSVTQAMGNDTENIEEQLNNLESTHNGDELPDDLDAFLIRKTDGHVVEAKVSDETEVIKVKPHEDDGNDTDDLLRMLGEGDQKVKKKTFKMTKSDKNDDQGSSDDDDFIYERSQIKTLKLAKNALIKRTATKAIPEDMSDGDDETDQSSDEGNTVKRIFEMKKPPSSGKKPEPKGIVKHVVQVNSTNRSQKPKPDQKFSSKTVFTSQKSNQKSVTPTASQKPSKTSVESKTPKLFKVPEKPIAKEKVLKPDVKDGNVVASRNEEFDEMIDGEEFLEEDFTDLDEEVLVALSFYATGSYQRLVGGTQGTMMSQQSVSRAIREVTNALNANEILNKWLKFPHTRRQRDFIKQRFYEKFRIPAVTGCIDGTHVAIVRPSQNEERFYNRKGYHSRNVLIEFGEESEGEGSKKQRIMKPEMMDEEVPSDAESQSEDGSLYDELPSSDSEDLDDWFTLDIRAERAGDYLPLLGVKARDLLIAERRRVSAKVDALRQSLSALTESARRQADQLRSAAMALAEIDDTLRAA